MENISVYHNPRCGKSRAAIAYLEEKGLQFEVIKYFDQPFSIDSLKELLGKLDMGAADLLRKNEKFFKENLKGKELTEDQVIGYMLEEPKLIERPIIVCGNKAVIGRPTENIDKLL